MGKVAERFLNLFEGFKGAHGQTEVLTNQRNGKQQAKYVIVREPLTVELVQQHLDGKLGKCNCGYEKNTIEKVSWVELDYDDAKK